MTKRNPSGNERRAFLKKMAIFPVLSSGLIRKEKVFMQTDDLIAEIRKINKIDIHMHISSDAEYLREVMDDLNLKMNTICNIGFQPDRLKVQVDAAIEFCRKYPRYYAWCTTFNLDKMFETGWAERVNEFLKDSFNNGALAVKFWKDIGMQARNPGGDFVQADDPVFKPVLKFIQSEGKTLFTHIGDPVNSWLSYSSDWKNHHWYEEGADITRNRIGSFTGQVPYEKLMLARDRLLANHPDLKVIGCHMASMAFDLDEVGKRLDRFPNFAVDTSLTVPSLMGQAREKVREFFTRYQDRILYGLDESGGMIPAKYLRDMSKVNQQWTVEEVRKEKKDLFKKYMNDFIYYFTDQEINRGKYSIRGLALPEEVLHKIFYCNAVKWVPGIDREYRQEL